MHKNSSRKAGPIQGIILLAVTMFPVMGVVLIAPIAPMLGAAFADQPGAAYLTGIALTAPALAVALFSPFIGALVDRFGALRTLLWALTLYAPIGVAPMVLDNLFGIIACRLALGVAEAAIMTSIFSLLAGYYQHEDRTRWIAYLTTVAGLGGMVLYIVGGALGEIGWRATFGAYGLSWLIILPAFYFLYEPSSVKSTHELAAEQQKERVPYASLLSVCGLTMINAFFFYIIPLQFSVLLTAAGIHSPAQLGLMIAIAGCGYPLGGLSYRLLCRKSQAALLGGYGILAAFGLAWAAMALTPPQMIVGAFIHQVASGALYAILQNAVMRILPPSRQGFGNGASMTAFAAGQFVCPVIVTGVLGASVSLRSGFATLAFALFVFALAASYILRRISGRPDDGAAGFNQRSSLLPSSSGSDRV
jgi:MFS family permease